MSNNRKSRRNFLRTAGLFVAGTSVVALTGARSVFAMMSKFSIQKSFAVEGYDAVAYFTENRAVRGNSDHQFSYMGAPFRFASAANRDIFAANPEAYAPQYGGYCAYAVSRGYTATGSPTAWTIHDGKLYLNVSKIVRALWSTNKSGNIKNADENWPNVLG
ncbi:MAG: YHS domain-containing (seleno)protein [Alphaproteobacteria bacterium]